MVRKIVEGLIIAAFLLVILLSIDFSSAPPTFLKDYFFINAVRETGSVNLVSAIYLNYRAFDTLGETIVLLLAVTGVISVMGEKK